MAIIDRKLDDDAARAAMEYAARNDTAVNQDWQQPPPAYEELRGSTSGGSHHPHSVHHGRNERDGRREGEFGSGEEGRARRGEEGRARTSSSQDHSVQDTEVESDENTPLLSRRQRLFLHKKREARRKIKRGIRFTAASLLLACVALMLLKAAGLLEKDDVSNEK